MRRRSTRLLSLARSYNGVTDINIGLLHINDDKEHRFATKITSKNKLDNNDEDNKNIRITELNKKERNTQKI